MPRRPPFKFRLDEVAAFVDQHLVTMEATERAAFQHLGLPPEDARGFVRVKDLSVAFACTSPVASRLMQTLLNAFPDTYEAIQLEQGRQGLARKR